MILQIAPRCDDGEELTLECFASWLAAAQGCRAAGGEIDALDRCVASVLTKRVMDDPKRAVASHAALQRWMGSELSECAKQALAPNANGLDERRIAPGATQAGWNGAWEEIVATETPWAIAKALETAVRTGGALILPEGVTREEAETMRAVAAGKAKPDRVTTRPVAHGRKVACPHCNYVLPAVQQERIWTIRVATCDYFRRRRVIINVSL